MRRLTFLLVLLATALVGAGPGTTNAQQPPQPGARPTHDEVRAYWTAARMARAIPRDYVIDERGAIERGVPRTPAAKPPGSPGGGGGGGTDTSCTDSDPVTACAGASWPGADSDDYATTASGRAYFTMGGTDYVCSGAITKENEANRVVVLTAGHCVYDEVSNDFASKWMFIANYDERDAYFQTADVNDAGCNYLTSPTETSRCWVADKLVASSDWASGDQLNVNWESDYGFAVFEDASLLSGASAGYAVAAAPSSGSSAVFAFGYPAAKPYDGTDLIYCNGSTINGPDAGTWGLKCKMNSGSSGGPWIGGTNPNDGGATLMSLNSFILRSTKGYMFGPRFTDTTVAAWNAAAGSTIGAGNECYNGSTLGACP